MDKTEVYLQWSIFVAGFMIASLYLVFIVWLFEGFPRGLTELDKLLVNSQLIGLGVILITPLMVNIFSKFKVVRRD